MRTISIPLIVASLLALATALPASASEQALREFQAMSDMTDAELQEMADDLGKTLEELGVLAKEDMGFGKPKTVTKTLDEIREMSPAELEAFAAEIGNAACVEVRQSVEWYYPHGVLIAEQQFTAIERLKSDLASCQSALAKDEQTVDTFITGKNRHLSCLKQALLIPRPEAYDKDILARHVEQSDEVLEASSNVRNCYEAYEVKFNQGAE